MGAEKPTNLLDEKSKEKLKKMRDENTAFLKDQIEHLKIQAQYSKLKADIAENTYKERVYKVKFAEMEMAKKDQKEPPKKDKS